MANKTVLFDQSAPRRYDSNLELEEERFVYRVSLELFVTTPFEGNSLPNDQHELRSELVDEIQYLNSEDIKDGIITAMHTETRYGPSWCNACCEHYDPADGEHENCADEEEDDTVRSRLATVSKCSCAQLELPCVCKWTEEAE